MKTKRVCNVDLFWLTSMCTNELFWTKKKGETCPFQTCYRVFKGVLKDPSSSFRQIWKQIKHKMHHVERMTLLPNCWIFCYSSHTPGLSASDLVCQRKIYQPVYSVALNSLLSTPVNHFKMMNKMYIAAITIEVFLFQKNCSRSRPDFLLSEFHKLYPFGFKYLMVNMMLLSYLLPVHRRNELNFYSWEFCRSEHVFLYSKTVLDADDIVCKTFVQWLPSHPIKTALKICVSVRVEP